VDLPIENGDFPYSYVSLPEGIPFPKNIHQTGARTFVFPPRLKINENNPLPHDCWFINIGGGTIEIMNIIGGTIEIMNINDWLRFNGLQV